MDRTAFLKTMIQVLKYDLSYKGISNRERLLSILGRAKINFVTHNVFARRSYQYWETVEIRLPVPLLAVAQEHKEDLKSLVEFVYEESEDYALQDVEIKPQVIDAPEEIKEYNVVFDEIQDTVIQGIRNAKFIIWAAVAWFTNDAIYQELLSKKAQGLSIRILVSDEDNNKEMISKLKETGFDVKVIPKWGVQKYNRMHDKFCIIDMDYVMHGSYNWTPTADYNKETLSTAVDHEFVSKFADEFMNLYNRDSIR